MTTRTKKARLVAALGRRWLTPLDAVGECGIFSLSQRCGELKREGHCVIDKWVTLPSGSRVKAYRMVKPSKWTA